MCLYRIRAISPKEMHRALGLIPRSLHVFLHAVRSPPLFPLLSASLCPHPAWCAVHMTCSLRFALAGVVLGLGPIDSLAAWTLTDDPRLFGQRTRLPDVSAKAPL